MISIIIPVFNGQEWLSDAIESALSQTSLCKVIIIDDGSTDHSLEIAKKYERPNIINVISQVNKGLASARNTGIMNADLADYILPLDCDDILLENCVERIVQIAKETNADIIAPSFKEFGVSNREVILGNPTLEDFKTANRIGYCSAIRKTALLEVGGYNPKMVYGWEDWDLWHDLLKRGKKLVTIPEILWLYRTKEKSMWTESIQHSDFLFKQLHLNHPDIYG